MTSIRTVRHDARQYVVRGVIVMAVVLGEQRVEQTLVLGHGVWEGFRYVRRGENVLLGPLHG